MLMNLQVRDFAIVEKIDVEFAAGMTVLTGETGAGKSILIDALGLVLGERGSANLVRSGAKRAEFAAEFDVSQLPQVDAWLQEQALDLDGECLLRRVINADGRSRAFINGNSVPLSQLKRVGELLLDIHGQHFHQSLGRRAVQLELLDHYGSLQQLRAETATHFSAWQAVAARLEAILNADSSRESRLDLLRFQIEELDALAMQDGELAELNNERQKLQNSGRLMHGVTNSVEALMDNDTANANSLIAEAAKALEAIEAYDPALKPVIDLLESAGIQVAEAAEILRRYGESVDMDPARRDWVEERLDAIQDVARKHRVGSDELADLHHHLREELDEITHAEQRGKELEIQLEALRTQYFDSAAALSTQRAAAAKEFSCAVSEAMSGLGMPGGKFTVAIGRLDDDAARAWGIDKIDFLISANPGQEPQPLAKIASGGELSRMSLSIQVIASDGSQIPTMIFDEVDSGVGGSVAEMVGRRLQELGVKRQVLCVTHLPQVASLADQHYRVSKVSDGQSTRTGVQHLDHDERVEELARMLGGVEITSTTLDHAAEMLAGGRRKRA